MSDEDLTTQIWNEFVDGSRTIIALTNDATGESDWRLLTDAEMSALRSMLERRDAENVPPASRLGYNLEEAAKAAGVSVSKLSGWLRRPSHPLPHILDGRRIVIVIKQFEEWLWAEATRNTNGPQG